MNINKNIHIHIHDIEQLFIELYWYNLWLFGLFRAIRYSDIAQAINWPYFMFHSDLLIFITCFLLRKYMFMK